VKPLSPRDIAHVCVCICTYKRPGLLKRLLTEVGQQNTGGRFTHSIVVVDNDEAQSGGPIVAEFCSTAAIPVKYCVEPRRGISMARNMAVENAEGAFLAFIDDDEFPSRDWLLTALNACYIFQADGVLGYVKRHFDKVPPRWLAKSRFFVRRRRTTGMRVDWRQSSTANVLLRKEILDGERAAFRPDLISGEDVDFFRRKTEEGYSFIWCAEAVVFDVIPPERWTRTYLAKRALLRGQTAALRPECGALSIIKSTVAVPLYTIALPFALLGGHNCFMTLVVKLCDHSGKLLAKAGLYFFHEYVSG